ncbi:MAG: Uma2 family endonuclease [Fimbriimonadales bacterium]|nr:Uma2 family endonuclease [Fimbriimonadales bacterium]
MAIQTAQSEAKPKRRKRREQKLPAPETIRRMLAELESLKLPSGDGDRMEADWHVVSISLLDELVRQYLGEPKNYFCGGNMFIYYSVQQAKEIEDYVEAEEIARKPKFKGPDFFLVLGVDGTKPRDSWVVWQEDGKYPDLVVEFISTSTREKDVKKNVRFYRDVFRTREYFWFDRRTGELKGYRLTDGGKYAEIAPNAQGRLWSEVLDAYFGAWDGKYRGRRYLWLRLYDQQGRLLPTSQEAERERTKQERERAEQERQRAEQERQRAEQAEQRAAELEAELKRLRTE